MLDILGRSSASVERYSLMPRNSRAATAGNA
jgi:hypothetical protein